MPESNYDNEMNAYYLKVDHKLVDEKIVGEEKIKKYSQLEELTERYNPGLAKEQEKNIEIEKLKKALSLPYEVSKAFFKPCPFCGNQVDVFQILETKYGGNNPYSWTVQCRNLGCIFSGSRNGDLSLKHLADCWNKRV